MALFKQRIGGWPPFLTRDNGGGRGAHQRHDKRGRESQPMNRGAQKRRRRRLRGRGRPLGNMTTKQTRRELWRNKRRQVLAEARLKGEGGQCAGQHDNQPNQGGATVQQEAAAPGGGATRGERRLGLRSTQHNNQPNYMAVTRSRGVIRGGVRP
jgi:hypothetical protein